ncbi:Hypothetical predicted protein [Paramuricea clavata]|uniref:Transposable element P transposase-like RNase H C-terminal domain-containing protein n=1 Tax=Paramuricea clavata TaxID=317549 RepID=A0A6S7FV08_PARCT|nr:Hypothetical predicted protein [Paramuricea clavata]
MLFAKSLCIALLLYSTSYGKSRAMENESNLEKRTGVANTPSIVSQSHRQKVLDATRVSPAQPKQNIKIGQKRHLNLPDNFIKNIARYVNTKQKRSMKMHDKKSIDYDAGKEVKNIHQRRHMKKEEVPQVTYSLSRGHTTTGLKRNPSAVAAAVGNEKVQEALVEKGIEVVGNAIDKQIANIEGAQNKSQAFLNSRDSNGVKLIDSPRKAFILGFAVLSKLIMALAKELLRRTRNKFDYVLTCSFSPDQLEMFFSKIRNRLGWNINPNALQFKWALRALLQMNQVTAAETGNCSVIEESKYTKEADSVDNRVAALLNNSTMWHEDILA